MSPLTLTGSPTLTPTAALTLRERGAPGGPRRCTSTIEPALHDGLVASPGDVTEGELDVVALLPRVSLPG